MTRVLVLNSGSSSLKFRLFDGADTIAKGLIERIGECGGDASDHRSALQRVMDDIDIGELAAVGHRVVHGGERFTEPTVIDDDVIADIEALVPLAPLHNPAALTGIAVARRLLPGVPQVAVFDTAFHATIPPEGITRAIDADLAKRWQIRRYGFHGTSVSHRSRPGLTRSLFVEDDGFADLPSRRYRQHLVGVDIAEPHDQVRLAPTAGQEPAQQLARPGHLDGLADRRRRYSLDGRPQEQRRHGLSAP